MTGSLRDLVGWLKPGETSSGKLGWHLQQPGAGSWDGSSRWGKKKKLER